MRWIALAVALVASVATLIWWFQPDGEPLTAEMLAEARARWQERRPRDYVVEIRTVGAREAHHVVEVRGGEVVSQRTDGAEVPGRVRGTWTIDGMFDTMATELKNKADPRVAYGVDDPEAVLLRAAFDEEYGYPRRFLRHVVAGRKSSVEWEITRFDRR